MLATQVSVYVQARFSERPPPVTAQVSAPKSTRDSAVAYGALIIGTRAVADPWGDEGGRFRRFGWIGVSMSRSDLDISCLGSYSGEEKERERWEEIAAGGWRRNMAREEPRRCRRRRGWRRRRDAWSVEEKRRERKGGRLRGCVRKGGWAAGINSGSSTHPWRIFAPKDSSRKHLRSFGLSSAKLEDQSVPVAHSPRGRTYHVTTDRFISASSRITGRFIAV